MDGAARNRLRTRLGLTQQALGEVLYCDGVQVFHHEHEGEFGDPEKRRPVVRFRGDVYAALERALQRHSPAVIWPAVNMKRVDRVALILALGSENPEALRELLFTELLPPPPPRRQP